MPSKVFKFQLRSNTFGNGCPTIDFLLLLCWFNNWKWWLQMLLQWLMEQWNPHLHHRREQSHLEYQRLLWWLTHALPPRKGGRSTKAKLPGASLHNRAMQGSALRVGTVDVLQTDVRPLQELILPENNLTLLDEHRDLIIRLPGLSSFLSVCNVTSCGGKKQTKIWLSTLRLWCNDAYAGSLHGWITAHSGPSQDELADPYRASSKLFLILHQQLKDG